MEWFKFIVELVVLLVCIWFGARGGGITLGFWGGVGMFVIVLFFREAAPDPPWDVLLIILSVICATAAMQAAGGIDFLVNIAARMIRKHPTRITFMGPFVAWLFTMCAGTGHILYPLLPVIHDTAVRNGVRPERPMSVAVIASLLGITASPVSAATLALLAALPDVTTTQILSISIPATFIGLMLSALVMFKWGKELQDDPVYQKRVAAGEVEDIPLYIKLSHQAKREHSTIAELAQAQGIALDSVVDTSEEYAAREAKADAERMAATERENGARPGSGRTSAIIFLTAVVVVVILGAFSKLRPLATGGQTRMSTVVVIMITMLAAAAVITLVTRVNASAIPGVPIAKTGLVAIVGIFGLAWLGSTVINAHSDMIVSGMTGAAQSHPWLFAIMLFAASVLLFSQATTTKTIIPLGVSLGLSNPSLIAMWPAVNGAFFLPTYGTLVAALNFDRTGSSKIGKFILNHSYMIPGLVGVAGSIAAGFLFSTMW